MRAAAALERRQRPGAFSRTGSRCAGDRRRRISRQTAAGINLLGSLGASRCAPRVAGARQPEAALAHLAPAASPGGSAELSFSLVSVSATRLCPWGVVGCQHVTREGASHHAHAFQCQCTAPGWPLHLPAPPFPRHRHYQARATAVQPQPPVCTYSTTEPRRGLQRWQCPRLCTFELGGAQCKHEGCAAPGAGFDPLGEDSAWPRVGLRDCCSSGAPLVAGWLPTAVPAVAAAPGGGTLCSCHSGAVGSRRLGRRGTGAYARALLPTRPSAPAQSARPWT